MRRALASGLRARLAGVRLFAMDVDGVLTDGAVWHAPGGDVARFHVHDDLGLQMLQERGVAIVWISGRRSSAVLERAADLGIADIGQGVTDKRRELQHVAEQLDIERGQVAYMGDDLPDLPALAWAGVALAPADAVDEVRELADYVCLRHGGSGAVREVCDLLLAHPPTMR